MKLNKKDITGVLFLFLIISFIALLYSIEPTITGLVTGSVEEYYLGEIPDQEAKVGKEFAIKVIPTKEIAVKGYHDNTKLFQITQEGIIRFIPTENDIGRQRTIVIVEYEDESYEHSRIIFNIKK